MVQIAQMLGIIILILALVVWVGYFIVKRFKTTSISLSPMGYILAHPYKAPVAFSNLPDAEFYANLTSRAGIFWDVYTIRHGKMVSLGNTQSTTIKHLEHNLPPQFPADEWVHEPLFR